jgi:sulfotransferase family protein
MSNWKDQLRAVSNIHIQGSAPNIALFATPRGGSTWIMELLASQARMKFYDEPFNIRRKNVQKAKLFHSWQDLMPETCDKEKVIRYINQLSSGNYGHMNPAPFRKNHRFFTNRVVFKIHAIEHMIDDIRSLCSCDIVCLIRHPIPTSLSRKVLPRLRFFLESDHYMKKLLTKEQAQTVRRVVDRGTALEQGIVSWCFENLEVFRNYKLSNWTLVSYEECVVNPADSCTALAQRLDLPNVDKMLAALQKPSSNIAMSENIIQKAISGVESDTRLKLILARWRNDVDQAMEEKCMAILDLFGIDFYRSGYLMPKNEHLQSASRTNEIVSVSGLS